MVPLSRPNSMPATRTLLMQTLELLVRRLTLTALLHPLIPRVNAPVMSVSKLPVLILPSPRVVPRCLNSDTRSIPLIRKFNCPALLPTILETRPNILGSPATLELPSTRVVSETAEIGAPSLRATPPTKLPPTLESCPRWNMTQTAKTNAIKSTSEKTTDGMTNAIESETQLFPAGKHIPRQPRPEGGLPGNSIRRTMLDIGGTLLPRQMTPLLPPTIVKMNGRPNLPPINLDPKQPPSPPKLTSLLTGPRPVARKTPKTILPNNLSRHRQ